jgi:hypothetical protein
MSMSFSNPNDRAKLAKYIKEIDNSLTRIDAEKDLIKDICDLAKDELEIKPVTLRKVARIYHKNALVEEKLASEEIFDLYEQVFSEMTTTNTQ